MRSLQHLVRDLGVHELMLQQDDCEVNNPADVVVQGVFRAGKFPDSCLH